MLLGLFVLAKAADYWLDRYDLVSASGNLIDGITYTDDHAVLPAKNILLGISVDLRRPVLPQHLAPHLDAAVGGARPARAVGHPARDDLARHRAGLPGPADRAGQGTPLHRQQHRLDPRGLRHPGRRPRGVHRRTGAGSDDQAAVLADTASVPLVDPQLVHQAFEQIQQVRSYYSVSDVLDVDRYDIDGTDRALVLGVRELDQRGLPDDARNWSNLHTVYTHGNGIIAAFANQRPADDGAEGTEIQWAEGQQENQNALSEATGGYESRVYYGEQSPDYSIVGKVEGAGDVELNLGGRVRQQRGHDVRRRRRRRRSAALFRKLLYAVKFGDPNFLLSERVNENSKVLYIRNPRERVQKVAPWLTVDSDAYPAVVDGRILWVVDGYTTTDRYPLAEKESIQTMTDDSLTQANNLPIVPTDQINYMRNAVKATVDAYDGTVRLYAWDTERPDAARRGARLPRHRARPRGDARRAGQPPALPRGPVQGAALPVRALPRHRPGHLLPEGRLVGGAERPRAGRQAPAAVPPVRAGPRDRRRQVRADLGLRAVQQEQPGGVRLRRLRRDRPRDLRPHPGAPAAQREHAGPGQHRQRDAVRPRRHRRRCCR